MININISNPDEIAKSDFDTLAEVEGYKVYSKEKVEGFVKEGKNLISKAEKTELSEEEKDQLDLIKSEISTLSKAVVIQEDLSKEEVYYKDLEKAKYFKREGSPGNYKYYYTEAQYKKAKGKTESKDSDKKITGVDIKQTYSYMIDKQHFPNGLSDEGKITVKTEPRDTTGMKGTQDKYQINVYQDGKLVGNLGSHPSGSFDASEMVKREVGEFRSKQSK